MAFPFAYPVKWAETD